MTDKPRAKYVAQRTIAHDVAIGPRIAPSAAAELADVFGSRNAGATYVLDSWPTIYRAILADLRGVFTRSDLVAMLNAFNGIGLSAGFAGQHVAIESMGRHINGKSFLERLNKRSLAERWVLEIWCAAFWVRGDPVRYPTGRFNDPDFESGHLALLLA